MSHEHPERFTDLDLQRIAEEIHALTAVLTKWGPTEQARLDAIVVKSALLADAATNLAELAQAIPGEISSQ